MRLWIALLLPLLAACKPAPEPKLAQPVTAPITQPIVAPVPAGKLPTFADPAVNAFVAEADAAARKAAPMSPEFWAWVDARPEVHAGLLFARHPMSAQSARNLDILRRALTQPLADKYAQLLLAVAIQDRALRTDAEVPRKDFPPAVDKVAAWMRSR